MILTGRTLSLLVGAALAAGVAAQFPKDPLAEALRLAGPNRTEIQKVLDRCSSDPRRLEAARFLISNMIGKAYKVVTFADRTGRDSGFNALDHPNLEAAQRALEDLEKRLGPLSDRVVATEDLRTLNADFLLDHIDRAFEAWQTLPWSKPVDWPTFRDYVLPYRGGKEPAEAWRGELMARYRDLPKQMRDPSDLQEAARLINQDLNEWVGFWDLYYLPPTEQGFSEMKASRKGRCGDLSNFATFALRANGIPCAIDYTPYWADTGNNHAWPVVLSAEGKASDASVLKAAKIYRKTFANQPGNLLYDAAKGETLPPWLNRPDYIDVTSQYLPTSDVTVVLDKRSLGARHAYLCVFNDGEWRPIQWGRASDGSVVFRGMGLDILDLPATFGKKGVQPAGPVFVLGKSGFPQPLAAQPSMPCRVELGATQRGAGEPVLEPGQVYELFVWEGGWRSLGRQPASRAKTVRFESVPSGGLYWLVREGSRREERPFTVVDGVQTWW